MMPSAIGPTALYASYFAPYDSSRFWVARIAHAESSTGSGTLNIFCSEVDFAMNVG
jgi:hypothetical protein